MQTVGRQNLEQRQFRTARPRTASASSRNKTPSSDVESEMPEHDLEPPRFSRRALECLLGDWTAVRSMIMSGVQENETVPEQEPALHTDHAYLTSQSGTTLLDKFTHCLLVKCYIEVLGVLIDTLVRELKVENDPERMEKATQVARRFVRSVARIFVIFSIEMAPSTKRKSFNSNTQPISKCKRVFRSLVLLSIEELCETADSLIAPVRLGVARPTAPFSLASSPNDVINVRV